MQETSVIEAKINELLNTASVLEKFKGWIEPADHFSVENSAIVLWPNSEKDSRRYVGALTRVLSASPEISKNQNSLTAIFVYNGVTIRVYGYKTSKCVVHKKKIIHAAEPEKIIPAKAAYVEEVEELVCEMPAVVAETGGAEKMAEMPF